MANISFDDLIPQTATAPATGGGAGVSFDDLIPDQRSGPDYTDMAKSAGTGLAKGTLSLPTSLSDLSGALDYGISWLGAKGAEKFGLLPKGKTADDLINAAQKMNLPEARFSSPTSPQVLNAVQEDVTGPFYQPKTTAGQYAETAGSFVPGAVALGGARLPALASGIFGGLGSEAAGRAAPSGWEGPARVAGGLLAGNTPAVASRAITLLPASPTRLPLIALAEKEGLADKLTAGQKTGYRPLQVAEDVLSETPFAGGGAAKAKEDFSRAFTENITQKAGAPPGTLADTEGLKTIRNNLQDDYKDLTGRYSVDLTNPDLARKLVNVANTYDTAVPVQQQSPKIFTEIDKFLKTTGTQMNGVQYQDWRSKLTAELPRYGSHEQAALKGIRQALDDAMASGMSPEDAARLMDTNRKWAVYKTIVSTANRPGEAAAEGYISPQALKAEVSKFNKDAYATGAGPLADVARMGAGLAPRMPNSGTASRSNILRMIEGASSLGGGTLGYQAGGVQGGILGAASPYILTAALGRGIMNPTVQQILGNQVMTRAGLSNIGQGPVFGLLGANPSIQDRRRQGLLY
jgi:hypothetical protein